MRERRAYLRTVAAVATGVTLAGCSGSGDGSGGGGGSDDEGGDESTPTATPASTATPAMTATSGSGPTAQSEYPDYSWGKLEGVSATEATTVEIAGYTYDPLVARVPAGQAVAFPNTDSVPHTVTAPAAGVDVTVQPGEEGSVTIDEPGTYDYVCRFHPPDMLGRLVVVEGLTVDGGTATSGSTSTATPAGTDTPTAGGGGGVY